MTCKIFDLHREWYKDGGKSDSFGANLKPGTNFRGRSMERATFQEPSSSRFKILIILPLCLIAPPSS